MLSCNPIGEAARLLEENPAISIKGWNKKKKKSQCFKHGGKISSLKDKIAYLKGVKGDEDEPNFLLQRFVSLRKSFKSLKVSSVESQKSQPSSPPLNPETRELRVKSVSLEGSSSKDSGLGEESPPSPECMSDNTKDSGEKGGILVGPRKPSSSSFGSENSFPVKKHVMIREPSLTHLPSARRKIQSRCRVVKTKVYGESSEISPSETSGTVEIQWNHFYRTAYEDVLGTVPNLDPFALRLIFENESVKKKELELLDVEEISSVLRVIYNVLYHEWEEEALRESARRSLPLALHCIQRFLIVVVEFVDFTQDDEEDDIYGVRERFAKKFRELLRTCELIGYGNINQCLTRSQKAFVEFWCALLRVPFMRNKFSPEERRDILRLTASFNMAESNSRKHRSSIF